MVQADYINYFKALVERNPSAERWTVWWEAHKNEMAALVPRGIYLRLTAPAAYQHYMAVFAALEAAGFCYPRPKHYRHPKFHEPQPIPAAFLQDKISFAELEKASLSAETQENELVAIKENLGEDDEIWTFLWTGKWGWEKGFAFVRDGVPYDRITTALLRCWPCL